ncbi:MAG TPA: hypothetical protein VM802_31455 [Chitinophaga sp.]|uniref:hypothetical protein n=1 Tax=Chitinophaga sp. TaxID=1869181 RepID=UPI002C4E8C22|nr:hypothetical protein [Chitinophaga sp.]HVI49425.1 hypothetical protein [Chitinophaga sp.]
MKDTLLAKALFCSTLLMLAACSKDKNINNERTAPPVTDNKKSEYVYDNKTIIDFKVYRGTVGGGKDVTPTITPEELWNTTKLEYGKYERLAVSKDSISELPYKYEECNYLYKTSNDSLYAWKNANLWMWYGAKKNDNIEYIISFYAFARSRQGYSLTMNSYERGIINGKEFFNDNPYRFKDIQSMTDANDLVAWLTIKYTFKKKM